MAVYDTPPGLLAQAIESIQDQTLADFEFLILDDGSKRADTLQTLAHFAAADARIILRKEPHRGLTRTLNRGLAMAQGHWVARQDADDWSAPERLARQAAAFGTAEDLVLCGTNAWTHQQGGRKLWTTHLPRTRGEILKALWRGNPFVHGSTMFRASAARQVGGYRDEFPCSQDYDFFWRLAQHGGAINLAEPLYHYRYTGGSVSVMRARDQAAVHTAAQILARRREMQQDENDAARALAEARARLTDGGGWHRAALKQADHLLLAGDYLAALRAYAGLVSERPAHWLGWAKLGRWAVFASCPPARQACFSSET
jgi:Glycosyl transferase family 2